MFDDKQGMRDLREHCWVYSVGVGGAGSDEPNEYVFEHMLEYTPGFHMSEIFWKWSYTFEINTYWVLVLVTVKAILNPLLIHDWIQNRVLALLVN